MKFTTAVATALFFASSAVCQPQSKAFYLVAISDEKNVNGTAFESCHEGAGIEALCVGAKVDTIKKKEQEFYSYKLNITSKSQPNFGVITWVLEGSDFNESQGMGLYLDASTNVGQASFGLSDSVYVGFDSDNQLYQDSDLKDTVSPPTFYKKTRKLMRWYTCETYFEAYTYKTLNWVYGKYPPENPTCKSVEIVRQYID